MNRLSANPPINELASYGVVCAMAELDYESIVSGSLPKDVFVDSNGFAYYALVNTWLHLASSSGSSQLMYVLRACLRSNGVVKTILRLTRLADAIVRAAHCYKQGLEWQGPCTTFLPTNVEDDDSEKVRELVSRILALPFMQARQICVFPKRFAPVVSKKQSQLHTKTLNAFIELNKSNVAIERRLLTLYWYCVQSGVITDDEGDPSRSLPFKAPSYVPGEDEVEIVKIARTIVRLIVGELEGRPKPQDFPRIGPGAVRDSSPSRYARLVDLIVWGAYQPMHTNEGFSAILPPEARTVVRYRSGRKWKTRPGYAYLKGFWGSSGYPQICRYSTVPKTTKINRGIAIEALINMSHQLQLKDEIERRICDSGMSKFMPITRQELSRQAARDGAITDRLATLDQSHASDSVTKVLVQLLFPRSWWKNGFEACVPYGFILDEGDMRPAPLHMFATMGCGCTFVVETIVFFSLTAAVLWKYTADPTERLTLTTLYDVLDGNLYVMGDDISVSSRVVEETVRFLEFFGFEVNNDKSFWNGNFRESCGADWLRTRQKVMNVTCQYWPRIPVGGEAIQMLQQPYLDHKSPSDEAVVTSGLSRLVALQQKMSMICDPAAKFLKDLIRLYFPDYPVTLHEADADTLWDFESHDLSVYYWVPENLGDPDALVYETKHSVTCYVHESFARAYWKKLWSSEGGYCEDDVACAQRMQQILTWTRREVARVPKYCSSKTTRNNQPGLARTLAYELTLKNQETSVDGILPLAIYGPTEKVANEMRNMAHTSVRPGRLSWSGLAGEELQLTWYDKFVD